MKQLKISALLENPKTAAQLLFITV